MKTGIHGIHNTWLDLKVGDVYRMNRARKRQVIVNEFYYNGNSYFNIKDVGDGGHIDTIRKDYLCDINICYGSVYEGVVEVNGMLVRGKGGILLEEPKPVPVKEMKTPNVRVREVVYPETDFQRFEHVRRSGAINMTNIVVGARMAGISEAKYEDIMWHYEEYKSGKRQ